jgi:hypothetical protein
MRPAPPSTRLALTTITEAPSVTYTTELGVVGEAVVIGARVGAAVVAIVTDGSDSIVLDVDEAASSSSSPPHAPSSKAAAATPAKVVIDHGRCRERAASERVACDPHARVTRANLLHAGMTVQANADFLDLGVDRDQ